MDSTASTTEKSGNTTVKLENNSETSESKMEKSGCSLVKLGNTMETSGSSLVMSGCSLDSWESRMETRVTVRQLEMLGSSSGSLASSAEKSCCIVETSGNRRSATFHHTMACAETLLPMDLQEKQVTSPLR